MYIPCTHPSLHIRHVQDAMVVFEAVRRGILPLLDRRLSASERDALHSGHIFVWEEGEHKQGLERWTDGRRWSQSRLRNDFLYYDEKLPVTQEEREMKAARRAEYNNGCSNKKPIFRRSDRPTKPNGLTKQTYSTLIQKDRYSPPKKWHIVAYFSMMYNQLPVIDNIDYLRNITIPQGIFMPSRGPTPKADQNSSSTASEDESAPSSALQSPSSRMTPLRKNSIANDVSPSIRAILNAPSDISLYHPSSNSISRPKLSNLDTSLISNGEGSQSHTRTFPPLPNSQNYQPLTPEDARALRSFELRL